MAIEPRQHRAQIGIDAVRDGVIDDNSSAIRRWASLAHA
jgi:hypothetical protein